MGLLRAALPGALIDFTAAGDTMAVVDAARVREAVAPRCSTQLSMATRTRPSASKSQHSIRWSRSWCRTPAGGRSRGDPGEPVRAVAALLLQGERGLPQLGVGLVHCAGDRTCQRGDIKVSMPDGFVNFQLLLPRTSREWVYRLLYCFPAGPRIGMPSALIGFQPHHSRKEQR